MSTVLQLFLSFYNYCICRAFFVRDGMIIYRPERVFGGFRGGFTGGSIQKTAAPIESDRFFSVISAIYATFLIPQVFCVTTEPDEAFLTYTVILSPLTSNSAHEEVFEASAYSYSVSSLL